MILVPLLNSLRRSTCNGNPSASSPPYSPAKKSLFTGSPPPPKSESTDKKTPGRRIPNPFSFVFDPFLTMGSLLTAKLGGFVTRKWESFEERYLILCGRGNEKHVISLCVGALGTEELAMTGCLCCVGGAPVNKCHSELWGEMLFPRVGTGFRILSPLVGTTMLGGNVPTMLGGNDVSTSYGT